MGDIYRVQIVRESGSGDAYNSETLFEVAGGIGLVARIAPGALVDALRAADEDVPEPLAERVMDAAAAAGAPVVPSSHPFQGEQPKRTRRTKAQIAADKEAEGLGFRDAAHRAEVEAAQQQAPPAVPAEPEAVPDGVIVPEQVTVPAEPAVAVTATFEGAAPVPPAAPAAVAAPVAPAAPYNPFEVK